MLVLDTQATPVLAQDLPPQPQHTLARLAPKYGAWMIFQHGMPFDATRCYNELAGHAHPHIWPAERDVQMWQALES